MSNTRENILRALADPKIIESQARDKALGAQKAALIPTPLRKQFEGWAKLAIAEHTGRDANGHRLTGEERKILRKYKRSLEGKIAEGQGEEGGFDVFVSKHGLDHQPVIDHLAGGLTSFERWATGFLEQNS